MLVTPLIEDSAARLAARAGGRRTGSTTLDRLMLSTLIGLLSLLLIGGLLYSDVRGYRREGRPGRSEQPGQDEGAPRPPRIPGEQVHAIVSAAR